ncbi:MAG: redoxin family protein [Hymenobacteraceae bacterium]|nr:redoxin family protein [Hymenobacteraceae bacterium]
MRWFLVPVAVILGASAPPRPTAYVFLAPTCPISQAVVPELRTLYARYAARGVAFVGVFPDEALSAGERTRFGRDYRLTFPLQADPGHLLTRRLGATITPEVALTNAAGALVYRGRINDQYVRLGQRRTIVQRHELAEALAAVVADKPVATSRAEAIGCLIEPLRP